MNYELVNADERAAAHPKTFPLPSQADRERVKIGACVKLIFLSKSPKTEAERMWVIVTKRRKLGPPLETFLVYEGTLGNDPSTDVGGLEHGGRVVFGTEHIIEIGEVP